MNIGIKLVMLASASCLVIGCGPKHAPKQSSSRVITGFKPVNICKKEDLVVSKKDNELESSSEAKPCVITQPRYPRKAALKGVSGHVRFNLTVSENGRPKNIKIIESVPEGVFDKSALEAIKKWRFKPSVENGMPHSQDDMKYTMEFKVQ